MHKLGENMAGKLVKLAAKRKHARRIKSGERRTRERERNRSKSISRPQLLREVHVVLVLFLKVDRVVGAAIVLGVVPELRWVAHIN